MFHFCFIEYVFVLEILLTSSSTLHRRKFPSNARYMSIITWVCYFIDSILKYFVHILDLKLINTFTPNNITFIIIGSMLKFESTSHS